MSFHLSYAKTAVMSCNRWNPKRGSVNFKILPRGPNGRALCRQCNTEVPPKRLSFCSDKCVEIWRIRSQPSYVRVKLYERDKGVCAVCGTDCQALVRELEKLDDYYDRHRYKGGWGYLYPEVVRKNEKLMVALQQHCISVHRWVHRRRQGIWDADHITPVVEGGGECGLDNYRTLCCRCHRNETTKLAGRRARARG